MSAEEEVRGEESSEPSSVRLITALSLAGLFSGLILVGAYELTLPRIEANKARALREAVFKVLPGVERMQAMSWAGDALAATEDGSEGETVYAGYDGQDELVGYAIRGEGPGFQDTIALLYGYQPAKEIIVGMEVLESRETPGLGDKIIKDSAFKENFTALAANVEIIPAKPGAKTQPFEVDTITGATISSKAVINIINATNAQWLSRLEQQEER